MPSENQPAAEWKEYPEPEFPSVRARDAYRRARRLIKRVWMRMQNGEDVRSLGGSLTMQGLTSLPPEIGQLTGLTRLDIQNNQLTELPPEIGNISTLTVLFLYNNQLTTLPSAIGRLTALTGLYLQNNQLLALPMEIGQLTNLTELYLSDNKLMGLPKEVGQLKSLTGLYLQNNHLMALPPEIAHLSGLRSLPLDGNSGMELPNELHGNSPKEILDFVSRRTQQARPLHEVKVLLVGRGETGKTSLSRALRMESFNPEEQETPGIDIWSWRMRCKKDVITMHLWDFAGQEITHETHRSFLTQRSLYLVVLDGRGGQQMEEAEYWLAHVQKYGIGEQLEDNSPVLVVLNKWKKHGPYEVERRRLQREFPFIRGFVQTDCADGTGITELAATMADVVRDMPGVHKTWPVSYFNVTTRLRRMAASEGKAWLSWEEYKDVCLQEKVMDPEQQESLAVNLNALGVALYYSDNPRLRNKRVLNPTWVANGLYALIQGVRHAPRGGHRGEIETSAVEEVMRQGLQVLGANRVGNFDSWLKPEVAEFFMQLLLDREIGFQASGADGENVYLLPELLPSDEPEARDYDVRSHIEETVVRWRYSYEFLASSVMSRLIVRTHPLSDEYFRWRLGVVLGWGGAKAMVLASRRRNPRVEVYLKGGTAAERQVLAGIIRANMEQIHKDLPAGLRGREELDLALPGEQWADVAELKHFEAEKKMLPVRTREGIVEVPPTQELNRLEPESARSDDAPRLKVFVSYSHDNFNDCDQLKLRLARLANEGLVSYWHDGQIRAGQEWDRVIRRELEDADVVVLLMSERFFASSYIEGVEMMTARARQQRGEADILPVLLEDCDGFKKHPWLGQLQTVPSVVGRLRPVRRFTPKETAWDSVENELRRMIADLARTKRRSGRRGF